MHIFKQNVKARLEKCLTVTLCATLPVHPSPKALLIFFGLPLLLMEAC